MNRLMRIILAGLLLLTVQLSHAQIGINMDKANLFKEMQDPMFNSTEVDDQFLQESAVVLFKKYQIDYSRQGSMFFTTKKIRVRVKMQDEAAVNSFSTFYLSKRYNFGIKVVKANGLEEEVDLTEAVPVYTDVPLEVSNLLGGSSGYQKMAIPNLEVGDILDYYFYIKDSHYGKKAWSRSIPLGGFHYLLTSSHPIQKQELVINAPKSFQVSCNSYHGAPKFERTTSGEGSKFTLIDQNRTKAEDRLFDFPLLNNAAVKVDVNYVTPTAMKRNPPEFTSFIKGPNQGISREEVVKVADKTLFRKLTSNQKIYLNHLKPEVKSFAADHRGDDEAIADYIFNEFRLKFIQRNGLTGGRIDDYLFAGVMRLLLNEADVDNKIVVTVPRNKGNLEEILFKDDLRLGIQIEPAPGKTINFFPFDAYSSPIDYNPYIEGVEAYAFIGTQNIKMVEGEMTNTIISKQEDNRLKEVLVGHFDPSMDTMYVERHLALTGHAKRRFSLNILQQGKMEGEDRYRTAKAAGSRASYNDKYWQDYGVENEHALKWMESDLAADFDQIISYDSLIINSQGRYADDNALKLSDEFKVGKMAHKVGDDYLINLGQVIGGQIKVRRSELERENPLHFSNTKSFVIDAEIQIPEGYEILGLERFNKEFRSMAIDFKSIATFEDGVLRLSSAKMYHTLKAEQEDWPEVVDALEAAFDLSQGKVLMKKIN